MKYKLGIDVGGTFTDFIIISEDGSTTTHKTLSTPEDPSIGVISGIFEMAEILDISSEFLISDIETIVHGTTVATNALLTLKGAKTALITTKGFRDALEMRRGIREEQYNNHFRNVKPLVPRYLRLTVDERIDAEGNILKEITENELNSLCTIIKKEGVEAIAICFMHSYINHTHEEKAFDFFQDIFPDCFISASKDVLPSIRFYERVSTTVVNAYIGPIVANYLDNLTKKLDDINFKGRLLIVQSNGGLVTPDIVKKSPAVTVLSGPAAAPTAGIFYSNLINRQNCITVDMGGTSFDASLVVNGTCLTSTEGEINRYKIALPALDIVTIGAGGGSIGWINTGGLLQMGPQSAGALPGPICYDKGGELPTCTDANLILGYLNPDYFAGGKIKLNYDKTYNKIKNGLAAELGLSPLETAAGMFRIINSNMAQGVRQVSIEKGHDPREFLFIVAGGAGGIHAGEICKELEIPMYMVPNTASIFCAAGMLLGDLKHDYVRSFLCTFAKLNEYHHTFKDDDDSIDNSGFITLLRSDLNGTFETDSYTEYHSELQRMLQLYNQMKKEGTETLLSEGVKLENIEYTPVLDLRYIGQYHEVKLAVNNEDIEKCNLERISEAFHNEHNRLYGYCLRTGAEIETINLRLRCSGKIEKSKFLAENLEFIPLERALKHRRKAFMPETNSMEEVPVYNGDMPIGNNKISGPAIIEKADTSIFISCSYDCIVDKYCSFIIYDKKKLPQGLESIISMNIELLAAD